MFVCILAVCVLQWADLILCTLQSSVIIIEQNLSWVTTCSTQGGRSREVVSHDRQLPLYKENSNPWLKPRHYLYTNPWSNSTFILSGQVVTGRFTQVFTHCGCVIVWHSQAKAVVSYTQEVLGLVISSTRQGSINGLVCIYCGYNIMFIWVFLISKKTFTPNRPLNAGTEGVTARVLVILSGSFTGQIETGPALTLFSDSWGIHSPQCWEPGFNSKYTMHTMTVYWNRTLACQADVLTTALPTPLYGNTECVNTYLSLLLVCLTYLHLQLKLSLRLRPL